MQKYKYLTLLVFLFLSFSMSKGFSQTTIDTSLLEGTWVLNYQQTLDAMSSESQVRFEKIKSNPLRLARFEGSYKNRTMHFLQEGVYKQDLSNGKNIEAGWTIVQGNTIELVNANGAKTSYRIISLTTDKLILESIRSGKKQPLLAVRYFDKNQ